MRIQESKDYYRLVDLFVRNGLENPNPELDDYVIKAWEIVEGDKVVGGSSLSQVNGAFILDNLAIDKDYRGRGWSNLLLKKVFTFLEEQNCQRLYLVTKIPSYFRKIGFQKISRKEAPDFSECFSCEQYGVDCFPEVMVKIFE